MMLLPYIKESGETGSRMAVDVDRGARHEMGHDEGRLVASQQGGDISTPKTNRSHLQAVVGGGDHSQNYSRQKRLALLDWWCGHKDGG